MTRFVILKSVLLVLVMGAVASATTLTYSSWQYVQNYGISASGGAGDATCASNGGNTASIATGTPGGSTPNGTPCEQELEEHNMYVWKIGGINLAGANITSATLKISNITNWDTNANELFMHLLNSATNNGITRVQVDNPAIQPVSPPFHDYWTAGSYPTTSTNAYTSANVVGAGASNLIPSAYGVNAGGNTTLNDGTVQYGNHVGTWTGQGTGGNQNGSVTNLTFPNAVPAGGADFVYTFSGADLVQLAAYIAAGGDIALGFDPNCHFWNDGITLTINTSAAGGGGSVPEPATLLLLGGGLLALARRKKKAQK
jgi:hypothetical protein